MTSDMGSEGIALAVPDSSTAIAPLSSEAHGLLLRMFSDPYQLGKNDCALLVEQLRHCVEQYPNVSELRIVLGMALCVSLDAQSALEELRESVRLSPGSFLAQLKLGELCMRLRIMDEAEAHTKLASAAAQNPIQSKLAREQAADIRRMRREGIERGGYSTPLRWFAPALRRIFRKSEPETVLALDAN